MNKVFIGLMSAAALVGLAACDEGGDAPAPEQTAPLEEPAEGTDDTTTQGLEPDAGGTGEDTQQ
ncbi:hypothetical protein [Chelativorans salis]|uniref:Lipoprotein n=1 Tax=Chelativorans salis TaxID=2978478 RepID=A0ABT2LMU4_9HYPH|nr:hypothetical protein [Chelativorans sp. EGI FJ00035]MCT7374998.1 hypothetical protein [Chelativorans sp. EGI FJ00035]